MVETGRRGRISCPEEERRAKEASGGVLKSRTRES